MGFNNTNIVSGFASLPCEREDVKMRSCNKSGAKFSNNSETKADRLL